LDSATLPKVGVGVARWTPWAGRMILTVTRSTRNEYRAIDQPVLKYFALVFAFSWSVWFAASAIPAPGSPGTTVFSLLRGPLYLTGVFAPAICALALTARAQGSAGVWALARRIGRWHVKPKWYIFAAGYTIAIKLAVALIVRIASGSWPRFGSESTAIIVLALLTSTWVQAGEELGWRGYALPRLSRRFGLGRASIILGAIWAAWHLPLFFAPEADTFSQSFPAYFLGVTALSVAMAWLYWKTGGSLLLVMLLHAAYNNTKDIVPSAAVTPGPGPFTLHATAVAWTTVALMWACAGFFLVRMRGAIVDKHSAAGPPHP
jgi:membrane protease YdiL (CAAX protease family)